MNYKHLFVLIAGVTIIAGTVQRVQADLGTPSSGFRPVSGKPRPRNHPLQPPAAVGADLSKRVIPLRGELFPTTREPQFQTAQATDGMLLPAQSATMGDCFRIVELLYGPGQFSTLDSLPLVVGFFEIRSPKPVDVIAVYTTSIDTATGMIPGTPGIHVERIEGRLVE